MNISSQTNLFGYLLKSNTILRMREMQNLRSKSHWDFLPPASQSGNKVTLTVFQGDFSN